MKDRQVFKTGFASRDSAWAGRHYLRASFCLKLEHRVKDEIEDPEKEVSHASQTLTYI